MAAPGSELDRAVHTGPQPANVGGVNVLRHLPCPFGPVSFGGKTSVHGAGQLTNSLSSALCPAFTHEFEPCVGHIGETHFAPS